MTWRKTAEDRRQDAERYQDPEYKRNRTVVLRRAAGRCERCGKRTTRLAVDHITPLSVRIDHSIGNLQALCDGPGSCHASKTGRDSRQAPRKPADPPFDNDRPRTRW